MCRVAIEYRQFESDHGFKSPGFTVDETGNVVVTSLQYVGGSTSSSAGDYSVTEVSSNFRLASDDFTVPASNNPSIEFTRGTSYSFTLALSTITFNLINTDGSTLYNTGIAHTATDNIISQGFAAQGKTSGKVVISVAADAPATLYYGDADGTPKGTITVVDPIVTGTGSFSDLVVTGASGLLTLAVTSTANSTKIGEGALTVAGGASVTKDMFVGGTLTATGINANGLGVASFTAGTNIVLDAGNKIEIVVGGSQSGIITTLGSTVPVTDTTINKTTIGATSPSTAAFTAATVTKDATASTDISNKKYVDSTATALAIALGI